MVAKSIKLGKTIVYPHSKPYIIAEIGVNHEGSLSQAKRLIDLAKEGGADAAKFQSYKADTLASKNSPAYWDTNKESTQSQHELFQKYDQFDIDDYIALKEHCDDSEIDFTSTPFDDNSIEFLDPLIPFFKIASADITNIPFIRKISKKKKPIILSTGASKIDEINIAIQNILSNGCKELALLHCILNYPTPYEMAHLRMISDLKDSYPNHIIGYSDHTLPDSTMISLVTAHLLGAVIIEKHFTHDKNLPGNDHYHAMDINDLKTYNKIIDRVYKSLGSEKEKKPIKSESISRLNARRSIVLKRDLPANHRISENDLTYKRPAFGISPVHWDDVINCKTRNQLPSDHILQWEDLEK